MVNYSKGNHSVQKNSWISHVKYEHLLAGVSGGVVSTLALHPLDLLKIRFAVNDGQVNTRPQYYGLKNAVTTIFHQEGIRGFYRGVTPNCWGAGTAWGFYFLIYNTIKAWMMEGNENSKALSAGKHMLAAAEAGAMTNIITNPLWVIKTRLCLQYSNNTSNLPATKMYSGMIDALIKVYKYEGIKGLYKGFIPGMFGVSHGALQFMVYEELKKNYINLHGSDEMSTMQYLLFAATSKLFAAGATYPYQVLRARLQDQHQKYDGLIDVIKRTWRYEGFLGFYKGLLPNLLRVTPATAITFVVYENMSKVLKVKT